MPFIIWRILVLGPRSPFRTSYPFHIVLTSLQGNRMLQLLPGEGGTWKAEGEQQGAQGHQTVADAVELVGSTKPAQSSQTVARLGYHYH